MPSECKNDKIIAKNLRFCDKIRTEFTKKKKTEIQNSVEWRDFARSIKKNLGVGKFGKICCGCPCEKANQRNLAFAFGCVLANRQILLVKVCLLVIASVARKRKRSGANEVVFCESKKCVASAESTKQNPQPKFMDCRTSLHSLAMTAHCEFGAFIDSLANKCYNPFFKNSKRLKQGAKKAIKRTEK